MVWKPGASGNPGGVRRVKPFRDAIRLEIAAAGDDHKVLRRIARALLEKAASGDIAAITVLADRLDGRVPQPTGQADELRPQQIEISWRGAAAEPAREVEQEPVLELAAQQSAEEQAQ